MRGPLGRNGPQRAGYEAANGQLDEGGVRINEEKNRHLQLTKLIVGSEIQGCKRKNKAKYAAKYKEIVAIVWGIV